jgi:ADP-heptose:LPS heptosyltransferase
VKPFLDEIDEKPAWLKSLDNPSPVGEAPYFDVLIDTRNRWKEALLARKSVPCGLFIAPAAHYLFSDKRPKLFSKRPPHIIDRMRQQLALAIGRELPPISGQLVVPEEFLAPARQILPRGLTYVGFAPGAGNMEKAWPLDRFIDVASIMASKNRVPVFLLGPQEIDWKSRIEAAVPSAKFPLQDYEAWDCSKIRLEQTLAIGKLLNVAIANDSGTSHMLAAVDCPLVSLFGTTSAEKLAPKVSKGRVVKAQAFGGSKMELIPVSAAVDAIEALLAQ